MCCLGYLGSMITRFCDCVRNVYIVEKDGQKKMLIPLQETDIGTRSLNISKKVEL